MNSQTRPTVVLSLLGPVLDAGYDPSRWEKWRPTVSLCQQDDLLVSRLDLVHQRRFVRLARQIADDVALVSPETEVRLHEVEMPEPWDFEKVYEALHDFARAYPFDPDEEDYLVHITTGTHVAQISLFLLTEARFLPGRLIQTSPIEKRRGSPVGTYSIVDLDLSKYDRIAQRYAEDRAGSVSFLKSGIATRSAAFNALIDEIEQVAMHSEAPVLLMGPTGAGKSHLARRIYDLKKLRRQVAGSFVEVNCATLRGDAAMSALFGHTKGAFTGAVQARPGLLRAADGGLLFLDEIGELGLDEQAMLLRAVEEGRFLPVGADREVESRFQLIAGTNRDLWAEVQKGCFREDLLARINLWTFRLPGLAERREDIEPNLDYELEQYAARRGTRVAFNREARARFLAFALSPETAWSANFRDLNAAVTRMATLAPAGRITTQVVDAEIERLRRAWRSAPGRSPDEDVLAPLLGDALGEVDPFDRVQLAAVVEACRASKSLSEAGRTLFAASRQRRRSTNDADRLRKYLARFGLTWEIITA